MRESKAQLTDRLRREGRWEDFMKHREELKAGGMPAKECWRVAAAEFAPRNGRKRKGKTTPLDLLALRGKPTVSVMHAAIWTFEYLDADWIKPADAPSAGAWSLLVWARSSLAARGQFYKLFAAKIVMRPQEETRQAEEDQEAHNRAIFDRIFPRPEPDPECQP